MSQPEAHKTKKRKHAATAAAVEDAAAVGEPSTKRPKKDKDKDGKTQTQTHKHKHHHKAAVGATNADKKGKGRATDAAFRVVRASLAVSVPPVFASDLRGGVEEMLDSMLMRYIPALRGVVLAHDRLEFLDKVATIKADCPFANCRVAFDATVWSPQVGMKLSGKINLSSPDHISLLVHRTFNVSIPRHHITTDSYEFEYGPAENDPEFGAGQDGPAAAAAAEGEGEATEEGTEGHVDSGGRWVHKTTGTKLGDADGYLEFTVVGLTIANQMLSLVGSIQPDPFSPEHVPKATVTTAPSQSASAHLSEREVDAMMAEDDNPESDDDLDPFQKLGKMADEEERRARKAQEEGPKEKKRKRKEGKAQDAATSAGEKKSKKKKS